MTDNTEWNNDISGEDDTDEQIIELTDIVTETPENKPDDGIIELTDIVGDKGAYRDLDIERQEDPKKGEAFDPENDISFEEDEDTIEPEPNFWVIEKDDVEAVQKTEALASEQETIQNVSQTMIDAALERVIEKKFAGRIDSILFDVMERVIQREIEEIKVKLQKDFDQIGKV